MLDNFDRKSIGNEIRLARKKKKLSQFELAELSGIDEKQIYRIESGISSPKLENFLKIAKILELDIHYFSKSDIVNKPYGKEILEILAGESEAKMKIYFSVIKSLSESMN
ncbi:helix-turn-helix transcriptional regulator [bacterium]|nr:helix-turn-helix transcriptional regulator [bacterium]